MICIIRGGLPFLCMSLKKQGLFVDGVLCGQSFHGGTNLCLSALEIGGGEVDALGYGFHILFYHAPGGGGRGADSDTAGDSGALGIIGNGVLIDGNIVLVQAMLELLAGDVQGAQVCQKQVIVCAAGNQIEAS